MGQSGSQSSRGEELQVIRSRKVGEWVGHCVVCTGNQLINSMKQEQQTAPKRKTIEGRWF